MFSRRQICYCALEKYFPDPASSLPRHLSPRSHILAMSYSSTTSTFHLPQTRPPIPVTHPTSLNLNESQILTFPPFTTWLNTLTHSLSLQRSSKSHPFHKSPYALKSIDIQAVDFFSSSRLGFLKLKAHITNDQGEHLPGSIFMRGGSVAMLIILQPSDGDGDEEYALLAIQPRIPAGSLSFTELPAGMLDDSGTFAGAAAKEILEETGLELSADELVDLTQLASTFTSTTTSNSASQSPPDEETLQQAIYSSPGGSDEFIPIFLARKSLPMQQINELRGKLTGLRDHGENITLKVVRVEEVWKVGWRDGKTLAAMALYQGLKGEGRI